MTVTEDLVKLATDKARDIVNSPATIREREMGALLVQLAAHIEEMEKEITYLSKSREYLAAQLNRPDVVK